MVSTIKQALTEVGIKLPPVNQRIWQFLKDSGTHNANTVAKALSMPANSVSSMLGQLRDRAMVTSKQEMDKTTGHIVHYFTVASKMKKYTLLPITAAAKARPHRPSAKSIAQALKATPGMHDIGTAHLPPAAPEKPAQKPHILDQLNVREAYALYLELHKMFTPIPI